MNSKGFTLVELLGVIILLSTLAAIAISTIDKNVKDGRVKTCKTQERNIIEGAKAYSIDNPQFTGYITIATLTDEGYIEEDLKNPMTDEKYKNDTKVSITYDSDNTKYSYEVIYIGEKGCE